MNPKDTAILENLVPLKDWGIGVAKPLVIAGPCSCETEEQMHETAMRLKGTGVSALRAGIWKPRTRPGMFEGIGKEGLRWLVSAGKAAGLPTAVEVANAQHVEDSLEAGIDILWIGARTTVNPFSVQEVADSLKGVDLPVLVKNPLNPDLQLWIGGLERVHAAGVRKLAAVHRGFSSYERSEYRNKPMWEIPIELRRLHPNVPILVDPSHICGNRSMIPAAAQKAMDLDFDGLMIESHRDPENAWSDAAQQLTPESVGEVISKLIIRKSAADEIDDDSLEVLRGQIDRIDNYLLELMGERMGIARQIGEFKRDAGITILQTDRWNQIVLDRIQKGEEKELTEKFVSDLMAAIHKESIRHQTKVMNKD